MISDIYRVEEQYLDPHGILNTLLLLSKDPSKEKEYRKFLEELKEAGMDSHPLLGEFFVES